MENPPLIEDPQLKEWLIQDQAIIYWMFKKIISTICETMHLVSLSKAIWNEWDIQYIYKSNITRMVDFYE